MKIISFDEVGANDTPFDTFPPAACTYTNEIKSNEPASILIIVLDLINTPAQYQDVARYRLLRFLQTRYEGRVPTLLAALTPEGLRILHDFTAPPARLLAVLRAMPRSGSVAVADEAQSDQTVGAEISREIDVTDEYAAIANTFAGHNVGPDAYGRFVGGANLLNTFYQLQQLAQTVSSVRGAKSMIWAFGGFVIGPAIDPNSATLADEYNRTLNMLTSAGIVVQPIDTILETENPVYRGPQWQSASRSTTPLGGKIQVIQNFMDISQRTGGEYCLLRKDGDACFQRALDYLKHYYLLSYYAPHSSEATWHSIQVMVRGADLHVRSRSGYMSLGGGAKNNADARELERALGSPTDARGVTFSVRWMNDAESEKRIRPRVAPVHVCCVVST